MTRPLMPHMQRTCLCCGSLFETANCQQVNCSRSCRRSRARAVERVKRGTIKIGRPRLRHGEGGKNKTTEYEIYTGILARCLCPTHKHFKDYGGRGITVCERWQGTHGYVRFLADVGRRPSTRHSLDRRDNTHGYEPGNVRWATQREQMRNTRATRLIAIDGRTQCMKDWATEFAIDYQLVSSRISRLGWDAERALRTPPHRKLGTSAPKESMHG